MAMNPMEMMKYAQRLKIFQTQHPKVGAFLKDVSERGVQEGSVVEMKVTSPDGREFVTNIRLTAEDMETVQMLKSSNPQT